MILLASENLAPAWLVLPVAGFTLIVVAAHVLLLAKADMPASRKRIRLVSGMLMMLTLPVISYALSIADPVSDQRAFVLSWMLTTGLLVLVVGLAALDMVNTWRLHRAELRGLRQSLKAAREAAGPTGIQTAGAANTLRPR